MWLKLLFSRFSHKTVPTNEFGAPTQLYNSSVWCSITQKYACITSQFLGTKLSTVWFPWYLWKTSQACYRLEKYVQWQLVREQRVGKGEGGRWGRGRGGVGKGEGVGLAVTDSKSSRALRESKVELKRKWIHICKGEVLLFQTGYTSFYFAIWVRIPNIWLMSVTMTLTLTWLLLSCRLNTFTMIPKSTTTSKYQKWNSWKKTAKLAWKRNYAWVWRKMVVWSRRCLQINWRLVSFMI